MPRLCAGGAECPVEFPSSLKGGSFETLVAQAIPGGPVVIEKLAAGATLAALVSVKRRGPLFISTGWTDESKDMHFVVDAYGHPPTVKEFVSAAVGRYLAKRTRPIREPRRPPTLYLDPENRIAIDSGGPFGGMGFALEGSPFWLVEFTPFAFREMILRRFAMLRRSAIRGTPHLDANE